VRASPLTGRRVVVTRPRSQAPDLIDRLVGLGATVVELPVIAIEDPSDGGQGLDRAAHRLRSGAYQWVALTSSNAVSRLLAALGADAAAVPVTVRWAAVGAGTARTLVEGGIAPDLVPTVSVSEALAEQFPTIDPLEPGASGTRPGGVGTVLFPRAETVRGALAAGLRAKGWLVDEVIAYRTVSVAPSPADVESALRADAVLFTSSSTVERTIEVLGADSLPPVVVTIGPVTSRSAREAGLVVTGEASPHTIDGLVDALVAALSQAERVKRPRTRHQQQQQRHQPQQERHQQ
jgi:uroporphyrinogen-III synthase